jgi:hypothetical protein
MSNPEAKIKAADSNTAMIERRAWVRYPCDADSTCQAFMGARGLQWTAKVRNISRGGIGLTLQRRFELGTLLAIDVQGRSDDAPSTLTARVAHVAALGDGSWLVGCAFISELSEDQLQDLRSP